LRAGYYILIHCQPVHTISRRETVCAHPLRPREQQQRADIMAVGSVQRVDIAFSGLAGIAKVALPPRESIATELHDQQIGNQARMPAIAVRKGWT
jgi:hypothetical protein